MEETYPTNLIVRYLSNEATLEEQEELLNWVAKDPANQKIFTEWMELWEKNVPQEPIFELSSGIQKLNRRIDQHERVAAKSSVSFGWRKIAASLAIVVMAGLSVYFLGRYSEFTSQSLSYKNCATTSMERLTLILVDQSVVQLNSNSTLRYPETFKGFKREVYLTGEAFFEVTKDSLRPFIIHTGTVTTQVLGTSFNVKANANQIIVSVATGKVKVSQENESQLLLPNEKVTYSTTSQQMIKSAADLESELAWRTNTIIFDDTQLVDAARKLEKAFGVTIIFENRVLEKCLITGKYKNESLEKILNAISYSTGIQFKVTDKQVRLSGNGCE
jgi:transmembrane sensor